MLYSWRLDSVIPAYQSSPSACRGASPTSTAARFTRSGIIAAQANACGPPPERPTIENCLIPMASAIACTSAAACATLRNGSRSESA